MRSLRYSYIVSLLIFLFSCTGTDSSPNSYDGTYSGKTNQKSEVSFTVSNNIQLSNGILDIWTGQGMICARDWKATIDSEGNFTASFGWGSISGTFIGNYVSGTWECNYSSPEEFEGFSYHGSGTWSASKK